ncbi:aromatic ring-hydroxylating oxygenase subunit alpha [Methylobacterium organophilum]|uniref:Carnitine monooxygenase oxygenase subunit n=1 Tax=Methylobacterium organophilum TaxID=410 RepID=A0ABQ4T8N9_METOR|nr:aromatic ring-hydroxylating dioxygenase subunit alpha [Methylobacterium organophilum]UMY16761.1 aromatic ring-hydroxylating dioxygenase subunit alpha [Methylobacterium organophilum]GJE27608.1 Carnitine monooxygenase oxygenase subunit [Methylobacterium organophilum]
MYDLKRIRALLDERRPGYTLPQSFYNDPEIYRFDLDAIYGRSWIMIGFETEISEPGNYIATKIGETPVVVVRDRNGDVRGFFNSCRHRGAQICEHGHGKSARLVCPYHQWTYGLDGKLLHAGRMQESFDPSEHALVPIHVELVAGTIYACIADTPPDFSAFRDGLTPLLAPHDLANAKLAHQSTLVERANWKLVMENGRECYHCDAKHPELSFTFPTGTSRNFDYNGDPKLAAFNARMQEVGLPVGPIEGDWFQAMRFPLNEGCTSMSEDGRACVSKLMCEAGGGDIGSMRWALEPHSFAHAVGDFVFMFSAMPTGPQETVVTSKWLVHKDAEEGVDYKVDELIRLWTTTNMQDRDLAENNQRGVNGAGYRPGPYSEEAEELVRRFVDWYCNKARSFVEANA